MQKESKNIIKMKAQKRKFLYQIMILLLAFFVVASFSITYAYLTDRANGQGLLNFGILTVGVDYKDSSKTESTFDVSVNSDVVPGVDLPLQGTISGQSKDVNSNGANSNIDSYLRFKVELQAFEDAEGKVPVGEAVQAELDAVASQIKVKETSTTWFKSGDGYIYYVGNTNPNERLRWFPMESLSINDEVSINFPSAIFTNDWQGKSIKINLIVEAYQYTNLAIDVTSCQDLYDQVNSASSIILDYNQSTGLGIEGDKTINTSYCMTDKSSFEINTAFSTNVQGDISKLRIYSGGKRLKVDEDYQIVSSSGNNTINFNPLVYSLLLICEPTNISLVDSDNISQIYQNIQIRENGSLPSAITIPYKENKSFSGYYTQPSGAGTQIYDASGKLVTNAISGDKLYAYFQDIDVSVNYRGTSAYFSGAQAFEQAFNFVQTLNAYEAEIVVSKDYSLTPSTPYLVTTKNMSLTIKGIEKENGNCTTLSFNPVSIDSIFSLTDSNSGNVLIFQNINLTLEAGAQARLVKSLGNSVKILENTNISNFNVADSGGAIYIQGNDIFLQIIGSNKVDYNVQISNCSAGSNGGAIYTNGNVDVLFSEASIHDCAATSSGGAIYTSFNSFTFDSGEIVNNEAQTGFGGGIYSASGTMTISGGNINGNTGWWWSIH